MLLHNAYCAIHVYEYLSYLASFVEIVIVDHITRYIHICLKEPNSRSLVGHVGRMLIIVNYLVINLCPYNQVITM